MDRVNYGAEKAWKALHFLMRVPNKRKQEYKLFSYASLVRPLLEVGSACWDQCRGQINALDRVQKKLLNLQIT